MPHKVNPIDFENAEGNLGVSSTLLEFMSRKLPVSRLQRDLTDSTVLRNAGTALAHTWLALQSLLKGLSKLEVNRAMIASQFDLLKPTGRSFSALESPIQTILRRENYPNPYRSPQSPHTRQGNDRSFSSRQRIARFALLNGQICFRYLREANKLRTKSVTNRWLP